MSWQRLLTDGGDAWKSLRRRPLRSILSSLGIGIGVMSLIGMLSISEGAKEHALAKIRSLGTSTLRVENSPEKTVATRNLSPGITAENISLIRGWLGERGVVGAYAKLNDVPVQSRHNNRKLTVQGTNSDWFGAERIKAAGGRLFDTIDVGRSAGVCVVGNDLVAELGVVVGDTLVAGNLPLVVIGVMAPRGRLLTEGTGLSTLDYDRSLFVPITALADIGDGGEQHGYDGIVVTLNSQWSAQIVDIGEQLRFMLAAAHHRVEDFTVLVPVVLLRQVRENQRLFSLVMGAIAGLSLLVGGIGVMNVMLANIAEQTRDIGLRMALGAGRRRIVQLYLCHSVLLTVIGGGWGIAGGIFLALLISHFAGWQVGFSAVSLIIAPMSAVVTGIVFGVHPALQAAALHPAVALREA